MSSVHAISHGVNVDQLSHANHAHCQAPLDSLPNFAPHLGVQTIIDSVLGELCHQQNDSHDGKHCELCVINTVAMMCCAESNFVLTGLYWRLSESYSAITNRTRYYFVARAPPLLV